MATAEGKKPATPRKRVPAAKKAALRSNSKSADLVDGPVVDALRASTEAVVAMTTTADRLNTTLENTDKTNRDTAKWRKRATIGFGAAVVALLGLIIQGRVDNANDRERDKEVVERQAAEDETNRINTCQLRNDNQRNSRRFDEGLTHIAESAFGETDEIVALKALLADGPKDSDCDRDGALTTADYPPSPLG